MERVGSTQFNTSRISQLLSGPSRALGTCVAAIGRAGKMSGSNNFSPIAGVGTILSVVPSMSLMFKEMKRDFKRAVTGLQHRHLGTSALSFHQSIRTPLSNGLNALFVVAAVMMIVGFKQIDWTIVYNTYAITQLASSACLMATLSQSRHLLKEWDKLENPKDLLAFFEKRLSLTEEEKGLNLDEKACKRLIKLKEKALELATSPSVVPMIKEGIALLKKGDPASEALGLHKLEQAKKQLREEAFTQKIDLGGNINYLARVEIAALLPQAMPLAIGMMVGGALVTLWKMVYDYRKNDEDPKLISVNTLPEAIDALAYKRADTLEAHREAVSKPVFITMNGSLDDGAIDTLANHYVKHDPLGLKMDGRRKLIHNGKAVGQVQTNTHMADGKTLLVIHPSFFEADIPL